jgi:prepilin peptidase CpaA
MAGCEGSCENPELIKALDLVWTVVIMSSLSLALVVLVLLAVWTDVRTRRIPNGLTATAVVMALALRALLGAGAVAEGLMGAGIALAVLLPLFALGGVGGGDAKLLVAVGAFLGPAGFVVAGLATGIAGGLMALAWSARRGVILPVLLNTGGLLKYVFTAGRSGERATLESPGAVSVPYAIAIAAGTLFALWYGGGPGLVP